MELHVLNAFSINMLEGDCNIDFAKISVESARAMVKARAVVSHIGHADMATVVSADLGVSVPMVRDTYAFRDEALVAQYTGTRLPEGCTVLPDGAHITYWLVTQVA